MTTLIAIQQNIQLMVFVPFCGILFACIRTDKHNDSVRTSIPFTLGNSSVRFVSVCFFGSLPLLLPYLISYSHLFSFINVILPTHSKEIEKLETGKIYNHRLWVLPKPNVMKKKFEKKTDSTYCLVMQWNRSIQF